MHKDFSIADARLGTNTMQDSTLVGSQHQGRQSIPEVYKYGNMDILTKPVAYEMQETQLIHRNPNVHLFGRPIYPVPCTIYQSLTTTHIIGRSSWHVHRLCQRQPFTEWTQTPFHSWLWSLMSVVSHRPTLVRSFVLSFLILDTSVSL